MSNLARAYWTRYENTENPDDADSALSLWVESAQSLNAGPRARIHSALFAVKELGNRKNWAEASRIAEIGVSLIPIIAPRHLEQHDQQNILAEAAGLAALAASVALRAQGDLLRAVQLLELSEAILQV